MILPRQAPPVARTNLSTAVASRQIGVKPAQAMASPKIDWRCDKIQADQVDASKTETVLSYHIPSVTNGWVLADSPCTP
jgi:hypothetical protein